MTIKQSGLVRSNCNSIGIVQSFFGGVYGTAIGNTKSLGADAQKLIGISGRFDLVCKNGLKWFSYLGMLIGSGEIIGGAAFGLLGSRTSRRGRDPIVIFGFVSHMMSFIIIYLNLPSAASISETTDSAFIQSRYLIKTKKVFDLISNSFLRFQVSHWPSSQVSYWDLVIVVSILNYTPIYLPFTPTILLVHLHYSNLFNRLLHRSRSSIPI